MKSRSARITDLWLHKILLNDTHERVMIACILTSLCVIIGIYSPFLTGLMSGIVAWYAAAWYLSRKKIMGASAAKLTAAAAVIAVFWEISFIWYSVPMFAIIAGLSLYFCSQEYTREFQRINRRSI